jgi:hypothetical protein
VYGFYDAFRVTPQLYSTQLDIVLSREDKDTVICKVIILYYVTKHCVLKAYGESGGMAPQFLTLAIDGGKWSASRSCRFTSADSPHYEIYRSLSGPHSQSGVTEKRKFSCLCLESNCGRQAHNQIAAFTELSRLESI